MNFYFYLSLEIILFYMLLVTIISFNNLIPEAIVIFGFLSYGPIYKIREEYLSPVLLIVGKQGPFSLNFVNLTGMKGYERTYLFLAWRIVVKNEGFVTTAEECKCFIVGVNKERLCWNVHTEGQPSIMTINIKEEEALDFCAFGVDVIDKIFSPTENGWKDKRPIDISQPIVVFKVLVTSKNAKQVEANVIIDSIKKEIFPQTI